jgi:hypothetical protein
MIEKVLVHHADEEEVEQSEEEHVEAAEVKTAAAEHATLDSEAFKHYAKIRKTFNLTAATDQIMSLLALQRQWRMFA